MKTPAIPEVLPAQELDLPEALPADQPRLRRRRESTAGGVLGKVMGAFLAWVVRPIIGILFCFNYFTSILVTGWTYRWMQGLVLRGWWKQSRLHREGSFEDFCLTLGHAAPVLRPRWLVRERIIATLTRPAPDGSRPGALRKAFRILSLPWFSLWLNLKVGIQALFCTYLLTGWGCLLMYFSWEYGWLNSFNKGYEEAFIGPLAGFLGIFLFIAAMFYVPMAQVHQAVTGDVRAFIDFRFVWRLIQACPVTYVGLAAFIALASLPLEILKTAPAFFDDHFDAWTNASDAQVLHMLQTYLLVCCAVLFPTLLLARFLAASVYRAAVLKVVRRGCIAEHDLHPVLDDWLTRLGLRGPLPAAAPKMRWGTGSIAWWLVGTLDLIVLVAAFLAVVVVGPGAWPAVLGVWILLTILLVPFFLIRRGALAQFLRFNGRRLVFGLLFWMWFGFVAKVYVGEFLNRHPYAGFLNHTLVQLPCFDFIPAHLRQSAKP